MDAGWKRAFGVGCAALTAYILIMGVYAGSHGRVDEEVMPWYAMPAFWLGTGAGKLLFGQRSPVGSVQRATSPCGRPLHPTSGRQVGRDRATLP